MATSTAFGAAAQVTSTGAAASLATSEAIRRTACSRDSYGGPGMTNTSFGVQQPPSLLPGTKHHTGTPISASACSSRYTHPTGVCPT